MIEERISSGVSFELMNDRASDPDNPAECDLS
jgi:hypothetical protein